MPENASETIKCWKLSGGRFSPAETAVIIEKELPVYVNGAHLFTASITPGMEKEFVAGYLFGQGFINSAREIKSIEIEGGGTKVVLEKGPKDTPAPVKASYRIVSGGGKTAYFDASTLPKIKSRIRLPKADIFKAMSALFEQAILYRETEGVHAAALFTPEVKPVCVVEDIGRHNTLDKAIGYALLNGIDLNNVFMVSTGRMASEMVTKICRAGIPLVATKTAVTDKGLEIGRKCGLTIIGFVRDVGSKINTDMEVREFTKAEMKIYCGAERVI
ncbi:MAG: formate dehydrogenase accessory sulfurtransferase FdhD [Dehalococcoidales bacterium]